MKTESAIVAHGVRKRFRKHTILDGSHSTLKSSVVGGLFRRGRPKDRYLDVLQGIDLDVPAGTTVGILGRNGSGKSTLLKILAGIMPPDEGSVRVRGRISPLIELAAGFHPEFSGRENVVLNGMVLGMDREEVDEKFDDIVAFAELEDFIDEPVRTYSSGMYMRLAFSVAVHAEPDVLMIDEILAVGDAGFISKCYEKLSAFQAAGATIVLVSHDAGTIERWCHEAVLLENGRVAAQGVPSAVVARYLAAIHHDAEHDFETGLSDAGTKTREILGRIELVEPPRPYGSKPRAFRAVVRVTNDGETHWRALLPTPHSTVMLGGHAYQNGRQMKEIDRALLPRSLKPGESALIEHVFSVPKEGTYEIAVDLVKEGVYWFKEHGSPVLRYEVTA